MRLFAKHPLAGVGLDNFGLGYLGVRLPVAVEEIKDPHNFLVKYLTELGIVGALLCVAWMLRMAWEMTRPVVPVAPPAKAASPGRSPYQGPGVILMLAAIAGLAMLINILCSIDFRADWGYVLNELLSRTGMFAILLIGASVASIKSLSAPELDARPAPLLLYAMLAALAVFVVHNLIDFSMSEAGAMMLFAWLAGAVLGVRQPSAAGEKKRTAVAAVSLLIAIILWLIAAGFVWAPTATAEASAADAALAMRNNRPNEALNLFNKASEQQPLSADYAFRAAQAAMSSRASSTVVLNMLNLAIHTNPLDAGYYLTRARYLLQSPDASAHHPEIKADFTRALELNPNDVQFHLEYADTLASFKTPDDQTKAVRQYEEALRLNSLLKEDEPKRLRGARLEAIRKKIKTSA
jgi:tetratricopeptide (TPR) repeat protein